MVRSAPERQHFSRRRVFHVTFTNILLNSFIGLHLFSLFLYSYNQLIVPLFTNQLISLLFLVCAGLTFYGNGIYITSIILEAYTLPHLKSLKEFHTQFIATHLFHGPISHVLIYSGWPTCLLLLTLLNQTSIFPPVSPELSVILAIGAGLAGFGYAVAQIYNKTAPYQIITIFTGLTIFSLLNFPLHQLAFTNYINIYFFSFSSSAFLLLSIYIARTKLSGKNINWYLKPTVSN